jgi:hypothetical protein
MSDIAASDSPLDYTQTVFAVADSTGLITMIGSVPAFMISAQTTPTGGSLVLGAANLTTDYVLNGVITPRPANPTTISGMQLSSIPNPSTVTIAGESPTTVTDGEVELSFTQPGTYDVQVSSWPALTATFSVTQT